MGVDTFAQSQLLQARLRGLTFLSEDKPCETVATPVGALNRLLPEGGLATGSFVEILGSEKAGSVGTGAYSLALTLARKALLRREAWAVVDSEGSFYPPAVAALGYDLKRLVLLRPRPDEDAWAFTQLLRSTDISVCFWKTQRMDSMVFRRLQLAAERGNGLGFVIRHAAAASRPCWASLRLMASWRRAADSVEIQSRLCARVLHAAGRFVPIDEGAEAQEVAVHA